MEMAFTPAMKEALKSSWTFILERLDTNILWEHLDQEDVFLKPQLEYIQAEKTPRDQARKLLRDLEKRPAESFWKFIQVLYDSNQRLIAQYIMSKYKDGDIPRDITLLQHKYSTVHMESGHQEPEPATGFSENWSQMSSNARHQTIIERSAGGIICAPSTDDILAPTENRSDCPSPYEEERRHNPGGVYPMESTPRGLALIIDNEIFEHPVMPNRDGTYEDRVHLAELFQNTFHFEVIVAENCTAQAMIQKLQEFGHNEMLRTVDACAVAVLSHGTSRDVIYGTDGRITDGIPQTGTYITTTEICDLLSPTNCPALSGKPKLYIVQACRGGLEDTPQGQRYFMRDVVKDDRVSPLDELRNPNADICFLYATVENYVAYRNKFVPLLCSVFQQHVYTTHVKDMATILHHMMSQEPVNEGCLTVSEERGNLRKKWFLNPPRNET